MASLPPKPAPAASVILVRDGARGFEVLLVRRHEGLATHGGSWVFPGGKVDAADTGSEGREHLATAKRTAIREVHEEAGIRLVEPQLHPFSHWTTSVARPKRFATWFFVAAPASGVEVRVDGGEIVDARWRTPADALAARRQGEIVLPPATFVTLTTLCALARTAELASFFARHVVERYNPKTMAVAGGEVSLYEGDAGYAAFDLDAAGPRHRLRMLDSGWAYERTAANL